MYINEQELAESAVKYAQNTIRRSFNKDIYEKLKKCPDNFKLEPNDQDTNYKDDNDIKTFEEYIWHSEGGRYKFTFNYKINEIKKMGLGNCEEFALLVLDYLSQQRSQGLLPENWQAYRAEFSDRSGQMDHCVVVLNNSLVIDAHLNDIYPLSELPGKKVPCTDFKNSVMEVFLMEYNDDEDELIPCESLESINKEKEMIEQWIEQSEFRDNIREIQAEMSELTKIKTKEAIEKAERVYQAIARTVYEIVVITEYEQRDIEAAHDFKSFLELKPVKTTVALAESINEALNIQLATEEVKNDIIDGLIQTVEKYTNSIKSQVRKLSSLSMMSFFSESRKDCVGSLDVNDQMPVCTKSADKISISRV
ncbi:hypothetical protein [Legionella spiritensis]|uniref:Uncharacterized protein n=1 Tax=Legionella spiritensis TaxID=452 RepID=A0A0W0YVY2_LEGSP|nr:hypothetical protein [Legionella spiritensis]KTD60987.1 hypothetical protein Lspi_2898 [Legionella spiritensis]SNV32203.1 Uncharacterised protein [Legionella spiritensis]